MKKTLVPDYGWVLKGSQRRKILLVMDKPKTPTLVKEQTGIKVSNVSDVLRAMSKRKLAHCLNPKEKQGRLYELTATGRVLRDELREINKGREALRP
ncbi:MAG TPA: hypothetical protein VJC21_01060 [Candidatus Nanoarchaeia archaeon]|nr:hypothetical protein [Candidatus Nanoarchaeia archaeon]